MLSSKRTLSLYFNYFNTKTNGWALCNQIVDSLWIGMLPTLHAPLSDAINMDDKIIHQIKQATPHRPLRLVVSVVEEDELMGKGFIGITTVKPGDWQKKNVGHHLLEMADFTANVSVLDSIKTVLKIKQCIDNGGSVYVHCKAGRARSAMICAIYLAVFTINPATQQNYTLAEAEALLATQRQQVSLGKSKKRMAQFIIDQFKQYRLAALIKGECQWEEVAPLLPKDWHNDLYEFLQANDMLATQIKSNNRV